MGPRPRCPQRRRVPAVGKQAPAPGGRNIRGAGHTQSPGPTMAMGYNGPAVGTSPALAEAPEDTGPMPETPDDGSHATILVGDDDADLPAPIREVLTLNGYTVIGTGDPFE